MSSYKAYMLWHDTFDIGDHTFHQFRVNIFDPNLASWLQLIDDGTWPLMLLDVPTLIPDPILKNATFDKTSGGQWVAPEDCNFVYLSANPFFQGIHPTAPIEANIIIANAIAEVVYVIYIENETPSRVTPFLPGLSPHETNPAASGWRMPDYGDYAYVEQTIAQRNTSFQTAGLEWWAAWVYDSCTLDPLHIMNKLADADISADGFYSWDSAYFIESCKEGTSSGYKIERSSVAGSETLSIWLFENQIDPTLYYSPLVLPSAASIQPSIIAPLSGLFFILSLIGWPGYGGPSFHFSARHEEKGLASDGRGLASDGRGLASK